ncbi:hypothetical protein, partial [Propionibacterium australiense]|uniref:hypothetical protein n=1 Tax=Propionibacterium australiense TaxID=119981 RepID=UPI001C7D24BF
MRRLVIIGLGFILFGGSFTTGSIKAHGCDASDPSCSGNDLNRFDVSVANDPSSDYSVSVSESYQAPGADNASDYGPMTGTPGQAPVGPAQPQDTQ